MNFNYNILLLSIFILTFSSCEDDDNSVTSIPERDRTEQQVIDNDSLIGYLNTHYYNSSEVNGLTNPTMQDLVISELMDGETLPSNSSFLINDVETLMTTHMDVEYEYYILKIKQGEGELSPNFCDNVRTSYYGFTTDGAVFDESTSPTPIDLAVTIPGWKRVFPQFNTSSSFVSNTDGTVTFEGYGMGAMFLPSGLGYFSNFVTGIPSYSNIAFKFELMQMELNDHDSDNIPSYMEVSDSNEFGLFDFDTDGDLIYNYIDRDDDGDGTATASEIKIDPYSDMTLEGLQTILDAFELMSNQFISPISTLPDGTFTANIITLVDKNGNGIPNYLDDTETETVVTE